VKNHFHRGIVHRIIFHTAATLLLTVSAIAGVKVIPPANGVYHAAFPYFGPLEDRVSTAAVSLFDRLARKPIAWAYFSNNWFRGIKFPAAAIRAIYRTGAVPFVRIMPRTGFDPNDTMYSLDKIIAGQFDAELGAWAHNAKQLGIPLMVEFAGEPNGDWFPWSGVYNGGGETTGYGDPSQPDGPEKYRDAYRHIITLFRDGGADNITWVFHINSGSSPVAEWNTMAAYYPGDDFIDWIGESAYGAQVQGDAWEWLTDVLDRSYPELSGISSSKPLALLEYGVIVDGVRGHKAAWITQGLDSLKSGRYPRIKGVSYWHSAFRNTNRLISNMKINSSIDVLTAYRSEVADPFFVASVEYSEPPSAGIAAFTNDMPADFSLEQNYPNPFNPTTSIEYALPADATVSLVVYNALGQSVATLVDGETEFAGFKQVDFDGSSLSSGIYFYRLNAISIADPSKSFMQVKKMIFLK